MSYPPPIFRQTADGKAAVKQIRGSTGALARLLEQADSGPWWFDGRDIFHKKPGTNLDQIILPIPSAEETFHPSQAVTPATARLASLAPDAVRLLLRAEICVECTDREYYEGLTCAEAAPDEMCMSCEWLRDLAALEPRAELPSDARDHRNTA